MKVAIFASAGQGIGYGHYGRCQALKEGFEELNIETDFYVQGLIDTNITGNNVHNIDWIKKAELGKNYDVCVVDSYLTTKEDLQAFASNNTLCVFIDDFMRLDYPDGIVINGSIYAETLPYPDKPSQMLLLGSKYSMLRKPFWDFDDYGIERKGILLSAGASGTDDLTDSLCRLILDETDQDIFVLGRNISIKSSRVQTLFGLNALEMAKLMSARLFAVSAAGQTSYELARTAVPSILFGMVDNQRINLAGWSKSGFAISIGYTASDSFKQNLQDSLKIVQNKEQNLRMSALGPLYVDGQGVRRLVKIITEVVD
jgi:UDP-2,4-diacetamido-2,4,6-trideoxy-beta-L-altropyranose hydrolase